MHQHYTERELQEKLKRMTVVIDTREQRNEHIIAYLDKLKVPHETRKLNTGDYSFTLDGKSADTDFVIERKGSIDELAGNFTAERERFEREFIRLKAYNTRGTILLENCTWEDIFSHNYSSKLSPKSLAGSLMAWQARFGVNVAMCKRETAPQILYGILYYAARDILLYGGR